MAVNYSPAIRMARLDAVRAACAGGELQIVTERGAVLACFKLMRDGGQVEGDRWTVLFQERSVIAEGSGKPAGAHIRDATGQVVLTGLTVGPGQDIEMTFPAKSEAIVSAGQQVTLSTMAIHHK